MEQCPEYRFTVCICTRNRPESLETALLSVAASTCTVHQVIVSDDSSDGRTEEMLRARYPEVVYVAGPRTGLGANRNSAVSHATGTHVLFMDDDAAVAPEFFAKVCRRYESLEPAERPRTIISGIESIEGRPVYPSDIGFLGYMDLPRPPDSTAPLHTSVINATVFPRELFRRIGFDENLVYGFDESDISTRSTANGYTILLLPTAVNEHFQSSIHRSDYAAFTEASRLYSTFKRYLFVHRRPVKAAVYAPCALMHLAAHGFKHRRLVGVRSAARSAVIAAAYLRRYLRQPTDRPPLPQEERSGAAQEAS